MSADIKVGSIVLNSFKQKAIVLSINNYVWASSATVYYLESNVFNNKGTTENTLLHQLTNTGKTLVSEFKPIKIING